MAIAIPIITEFNGQGIAKARQEFRQLQGAGQKAGFILRKAMLPAAAGAAALGAAAFQAGQMLLEMAGMAADDAAAAKRLELSIRGVLNVTDAHIASVEDYIDVTQRATGIADDELRPAYGRLVRSTKDLNQAQELLNLALDISAATGKPVETVAVAIGKAYDGQTTALGKLGLGIDRATLKSMDFYDIQELLTEQFGGASQAAAETFRGRMNRLGIAFDELKENIGAAVLPILDDLVARGLRVADAFNEQGAAGAIQQFRYELGQLSKETALGKFLENTYNKIKKVYDAIRLVNNAVAQGGPASVLFMIPGAPKPGVLPEMPGFGTVTDVGPVVPAIPPGSPSPIEVPRFSGARSQSPSSMQAQQINVNVTSADPRAVVDALVRYQRQNGAIPVSAQ